jgi:hypothetical protein
MSGVREWWRASARSSYVLAGSIAVGVVLAGVLVAFLPGAGAKIAGVVIGAATGWGVKQVGTRVTMELALRRYRALVEGDPLGLFRDRKVVPPGALDSRERMMAAVAAELETQRVSGQRSPVLVLGSAGSGKTTFAAGLARYLARRRLAPVVIELRDAGTRIEFDKLAAERFADVARRRLKMGNGKDVWDYARNHDQAVVIADALDERVPDSRGSGVSNETEAILTADAARSVPLAVTSRGDGLRSERVLGALRLEDLPERDVADALVTASDERLAENDAREVARHLALMTEPLYFQVARDLAQGVADTEAAAGSLLESISHLGDTDLARCHLLDARIETFVEQLPRTRGPSVDAASVVALIALRLQSRTGSLAEQEEPGETWLREVVGLPLDRGTVLDAAADLTFVDVDAGRASFHHPIIQAYLAARGLELIAAVDPAAREWTAMLDRGTSDDLLRALRTYAMRLALHSRREDAELRAGGLADELVARAGSFRLTPITRLSMLATAAHVLGSVAQRHPDALEAKREELARTIAERWDVACPLTAKADAIACLARMGSRTVVDAAWEIALLDDSYAPRWAVVEAMADCAVAAGETLTAVVRAPLDRCRAWVANPDASNDELPEHVVQQLSIVAKFLPSGNEAAATAGVGRESAEAAALTDELAEAVRGMAARDRALGVEASLAQGLKHAARRYPLSPANLAHTEQLARGARFWYSRVMAVHALVRHAIASVDTRAAGGALDRVGRELASAAHDPHPWVKEAAEQGRTALGLLAASEPNRDAARAFVWHDESDQIARASLELDDATARLLADIALVLNMNEQGRHEVGGKEHDADSALVDGCDKCRHQLVVGTSPALPHCLAEDNTRSRVLEGGCVCEFKLCRYSFTAYREVAHAHRGQLSPEFCAGQRAIASELGSPPWQRELSPRALADFWGDMERRARDEARRAGSSGPGPGEP